MIKVIFFDAGDTLLGPHPSFQELFSTVLAGKGIEAPAAEIDEVRRTLAPHLVDMAEDTGVENPTFTEDDSRVFWSYLYRRFLGELGVESEELVAELYATFSDSSSYALFDDVVPALESLAERGYRLGLISNFEAWLEKFLLEQRIHASFEVAIISGVEKVEKPDPAIYRLALERAGVDPHEAVHVGDSPGLDAVPASEVGLRDVLLDRKYRYPDVPWPRVRSLKELEDLVPNL